MTRSADSAPVCFLIPYLGRWPRWSQLFLDSCARNPRVHFLLLGDHPLENVVVPPNVRFEPFTFVRFRERVFQTLQLKVDIDDAHKICDFRPFYGLIFADLLAHYEFWGYCDLDVVFGDLSPVLDEAFLGNLDVFTAYDRYPVGHFTILRNVDAVNSLGYSIESWRERLMTQGWTMMDEGGMHEALSRRDDLRRQWVANVDQTYRQPRSLAGITTTFDGRADRLDAGYDYRAIWENGRTVLYDDLNDRSCEVLYIHFMGLKRSVHWRNYSDRTRYVSCTFTSTGFHAGVMSQAERIGVRERLWRTGIRQFVVTRAWLGRIVSRKERKAVRARLTKLWASARARAS